LAAVLGPQPVLITGVEEGVKVAEPHSRLLKRRGGGKTWVWGGWGQPK